MPYINFVWMPNADSSRASGIIDDRRALADAHSLSFYINAKEDEKPEPVVVDNELSISAGAKVLLHPLRPPRLN